MPDAEKPYWLQTEDERRQVWHARDVAMDRWRQQELDVAVSALAAVPGGDGLNLLDPDAVLAFLESLPEVKRTKLHTRLLRVYEEARQKHPDCASGMGVIPIVIVTGSGPPGSMWYVSRGGGGVRSTHPRARELHLRALSLRPARVRDAFVRALVGRDVVSAEATEYIEDIASQGFVSVPTSPRFKAGWVVGALEYAEEDEWWSASPTRVMDTLEALSDPEVALTLKARRYGLMGVAKLVGSGRLPRDGLARSCLTVLAQSLDRSSANLPRSILEELDLTPAEVSDLAGPIARVVAHGDPQSAALAMSWVRSHPGVFRAHVEALKSGLVAVARSGTKAGAEVALACADSIFDPNDRAWVLVAALENRNRALASRALGELTRVDREAWPPRLRDALGQAVTNLPASLREQARILVQAEPAAVGRPPAQASAVGSGPRPHPYPRARLVAFRSPAEFVAGVVEYAGDPSDPILAARILDGTSRWSPADLSQDAVTDIEAVLDARQREHSGIHAHGGDNDLGRMFRRWLSECTTFRSLEEFIDGLESFLGAPPDVALDPRLYDGLQRWVRGDLDEAMVVALGERLAQAVNERLGNGDRAWEHKAERLHEWLKPTYDSERRVRSRPRPSAPARGGIAATLRAPLVDIEGPPPVAFSFPLLRKNRLDEVEVLGWAPRRPSLDLPSWSTGSIDPTDLLDRLEALEAGGGFSVGEFELWHALLRLDLALIDENCVARAGALKSETGRVVNGVVSGSPSESLARQVLRLREIHADSFSVLELPGASPLVSSQGFHVFRVEGRTPSGTAWRVAFVPAWRGTTSDPSVLDCDLLLPLGAPLWPQWHSPERAEVAWTAVTIPSQRGVLAIMPLLVTNQWSSHEDQSGQHVAVLDAFLRSGQEWGELEAEYLARVLAFASTEFAPAVVDLLPTLAAAGVSGRRLGSRVASRANQGFVGIDKAGRRFGAIASDPAVAGWVVEWCRGVVESLEGAPPGILEVLRAWEIAALTTGPTEFGAETKGALQRLAVGGSQRAVVAKRILARATVLDEPQPIAEDADA